MVSCHHGETLHGAPPRRARRRRRGARPCRGEEYEREGEDGSRRGRRAPSRRPGVQEAPAPHHRGGPGAARAPGKVSLRYLELTDYLAIAAEVTGLSVDTVVKVVQVHLANSA